MNGFRKVFGIIVIFFCLTMIWPISLQASFFSNDYVFPDPPYVQYGFDSLDAYKDYLYGKVIYRNYDFDSLTGTPVMRFNEQIDLEEKPFARIISFESRHGNTTVTGDGADIDPWCPRCLRTKDVYDDSSWYATIRQCNNHWMLKCVWVGLSRDRTLYCTACLYSRLWSTITTETVEVYHYHVVY